MKNSILKSKVYSVSFLTIIFSCKQRLELKSKAEPLPYYNEASFTPNWFDNDELKVMDFHTIPTFELKNQEGEVITEKTFENKIFVANFFFTTCPGICPMMIANMSILQKEFLNDDEVLLLSHTVTPEIDLVPRLKEYANKKGIISSKWHLVTGDRKQLYDLGKYSYFLEEDLGMGQIENGFLHTENFVLIDKKRRIRGIYNGLNKTAIIQLISDIKTLKEQ